MRTGSLGEGLCASASAACEPHVRSPAELAEELLDEAWWARTPRSAAGSV